MVFQLLFEKFGKAEKVSIFPVRAGDAVVVPLEYHPCVAAPGARCQYLLIMSAINPKSDKRHNLAKIHPACKK